MILYVYDTAIQRIGLVEHINSLQWLSEYQGTGEVKLSCAATNKNRELLVDGNRLYCTEQRESAVIREVDTSDDGKSVTLTVRALPSVARWADRVVLATENITKVEPGMLALTTKHRRGLPGVSSANTGLPARTDTQITWGSVLDAEITLAVSAGYGFTEVFDPVTGVETFTVYAGVDRTSGGGYNGYFGDDIGNLADYKIIQGTGDWKNVAIVGGQGEGVDRRIVSVTLGHHAGDDRREMWVDAKDISKTYQIAAQAPDGSTSYTEHAYTDFEYDALLQACGLEKLTECLQTLEVSATLDQSLMRYGIEYQLGDIVPVKICRCGLQLAARISAVRTVYESTGKLVTAQLTDFTLRKEVTTG